MTMKPFSLEEYLKNPSRKIVTRDGKKVIQLNLYTDVENKFPIIAIVEDDNNRKTALTYTYTKDGAYYGDKVEHLADLFFATEKCEGWINLYHDALNEPHWMSKVYTSEEEAKREAHNTLTTVKIEWEEYL